MYCSSCGARNDEDARYCEKCGADLSAMPRPTVPGTVPTAPPPAPVPVPPPVYYPPTRRRAWWYPIGVWFLLSLFFLFLDLMTTRAVTWSYWPIGILGIFMVGLPLLQRLEEWASSRRR